MTFAEKLAVLEKKATRRSRPERPVVPESVEVLKERLARLRRKA